MVSVVNSNFVLFVLICTTTYSLIHYRMLMKNLIINYYGAPSGKKSEVLQLIARVLTFSEEDLIKVGLSGPSHGWIGGMWSRIAHPPTSPKKSEFDKVSLPILTTTFQIDIKRPNFI